MDEQPWDASAGLAWLLAPLGVSTFLAGSLGRAPLVLPRGESGYYSGLLSLPDVELLIYTLADPANRRWFQVVKDGQTLPMRAPLVDDNGDLVPAAVVTLYQQGCTVVVNQLQRRWAPIRALANALDASFSRATGIVLRGPITANAYLTPPGAQGFSPHFDDHDVFVLQLAGQKRWSIYARREEFPSAGESRISREELGKPPVSASIAAGDLIYIPRGCPHEAAAQSDFSLHLTLGVRTLAWVDLITALARADPESQRPLTYDPSDPAGASLAAAEVIQGLARQYDGAAVANALGHLRAVHARSLPPIAGYHFDAVNRQRRLSEATMLRVTPDAQIEQHGEFVTLLFPGNAVTYPRRAEGALRFMIAAGRFLCGAIPDLRDDAERLALVTRLIADGFIQSEPS